MTATSTATRRTFPPLTLCDIQPCRRCQRYCNREHFAIDQLSPQQDRAITLLFCEGCNRGFEGLWVFAGGSWRFDFERIHSPANPEEFEKFQQRLRDLREVAA